jgi:uncharacterized repeat protein (TIGR01451 family)
MVTVAGRRQSPGVAALRFAGLNRKSADVRAVRDFGFYSEELHMKILNGGFGSGRGPLYFWITSCAFAAFLATLPAQAQDRQALHGHVPPAEAYSREMGRLPATQHLGLAIGLPLRNKEALTNLLQQIYDPSSTNFHRYLTPEQFAAQFGPTEADYNNLADFIRSHGMTVKGTHPNHVLLDVDGAVGDIENAFQIEMHVYQHPTKAREYYAPSSEPSVPVGLSVMDISGLNDYEPPHPLYVAITNHSKGAVPAVGSGPSGTYLGNDFRAIYAPGVSLTGAGQSVALLQFDGYLASDILAYQNLAGLPHVPLQNILLDGFTGIPTGNGGEDEVSLDLEMVSSMSPGLSKIFVYEAGPFGIPNDILNRMATDNLAHQISSSWGWAGGPQASTEQIFLQMASQGQTYFNACGDGDAFAPGQVDDPNFTGSPSSSPNVVVVGGTTVSTPGPGGIWSAETVWQENNGSGGAGGISSFYSLPSWQSGIDMTANHGSTVFRNVPDVAMTADNVYIIADNGQPQAVGGTSCASPLWAGFTALVNQQAESVGNPPVGFLNPAIYAIGKSAKYALCFHDTITGNNTNSGSPDNFFAVPGYDLCTGWGTPTGSNLINTLAPLVTTPVLNVLTNMVVGGNGNGIIDSDECDSLFLVLTNNGALAATTVQLVLSTTTPGVTIVQATSEYSNIAPDGTATNATPFEISTTPDFVCGTPIFFTAIIKSDQGTSTRVFEISTGIAGTPIRFDAFAPVPITATNVFVTTNAASTNGFGTNGFIVTNLGVISPIFVTNITSALQHVTVNVYVSESLDADLTLQLIAPDGTAVLLTQGNGGSGQNYGTDCSDADRTTFDDNGSEPIGLGIAPYISTFQPQQPLAALVGKSGLAINGYWQLEAVDTNANDVGAIQCWTLNLTPAACTDGGGQCPGIDLALGMVATPNPITAQNNLTYTLTVTNNGPDTATDVALNQSLPASVTFVSVNSSQGTSTFGAGQVSCNIGTLNVGAVATITVVVIPQTPGTIYSTASVGGSEQDLNSFNNSATIATLVLAPTADLAVSLTASPNPVLLNNILTYTAIVTNNGPSVASNVMFTNVLPVTASLVSVTTSQGTVVSSANLVVASIPSLSPGSNATVVMQVRPAILGQITATATALSSVPDPQLANNSATSTVTVAAASDLLLTMTGPSAAILGSNLTYQLQVVNLGPSVATDVTIKDTLPAGLSFVSAVCAQGACTNSGALVTCQVSNLAVGSSALMTIVANSASLSNSVPVTKVNVASVTSDQADPNTANNSASVSTIISSPMVDVVAAGAILESQSFVPTNGMIEPGEKVTVLLKLQNLGNIDTANLTATLESASGVVPNGNSTLTYGVLGANTAAVGEPFTFTTTGTNGGTVTAILQLMNNGTNLPRVSFTFNLALTNSFANAGNITIPDSGEATPYPSSNLVSGITGLVGRITVTLTNVNHTYPDDIDMLLVGPGGQKVLLMSHTGSGPNTAITNISLTFDDRATNADGSTKYLPSSGQIFSGSYAPSAYGTVNFPSTNTPAAPYSTNLSIFNGTSPNGYWRLFVFDSSPGDAGLIVGGWSLGITSGSEVNPVVDLAVAGKASTNSVVLGNNLTYTFSITNNGPNTATSVAFTNTLPANATFVSATNSAGLISVTNSAGAVYCVLTNLPTGSNITVTVVVVPTAAGTLTSQASVTGTDNDPNQSNNSATVVTAAAAPMADLGVTLAGPTSAIATSNIVYTAIVSNHGPGVAFGVVLTDPLNGLSFVSGSSSTGPTPSVSGGNVICNLGSIASGASVTVTLIFTSSETGSVTNAVMVATASSDPSLTNNNSAPVVTAITPRAPVIIAAGSQLLTTLPNGSIAPGQTVTVSLQLANIGTADTSSLSATLLAANGVSSSSTQNYGAVVQNGPAVARSFTFTASGVNGGVIVATLQLTDGSANLGTVSFNFNLPATNSYANNSTIVIPDYGAALPYPATINIANVTGLITKATVTLNNFGHQFPNDVEILMVAPSGEDVVLMSGVGGGQSVSNLTLTFDDSATNSLPSSSLFGTGAGQLVSGTYLPTDDGLSLAFSSPAPVAPYGTVLGVVNGSSPNGTWALYVLDNTHGDDGSIAQGWSLNLTTVSPVNSAADLGVQLIQPADGAVEGFPFSYTVSVTNKGPSSAANVVVTNTLAPGLTVDGTSLAGGYSTGFGGALILNVGNINANSSTNITVTATAAAIGSYPISASVGSDQIDLNTLDNATQMTVSVYNPPSLSAAVTGSNGFTFTLTSQVGTYNILATTNLNLSLSQWTVVGTVVNSKGTVKFTDSNASNFPYRYYRAVLVPAQ